MPDDQQAAKAGTEQTARMVNIFKTAVFKIHNPTKHKRAMLGDAMKRAHVCYGKLLARNLPDEDEVERLRDLTKRERRQELLQMKDGRHANPVEVRERINLQTGESMSFRSKTGASTGAFTISRPMRQSMTKAV